MYAAKTKSDTVVRMQLFVTHDRRVPSPLEYSRLASEDVEACAAATGSGGSDLLDERVIGGYQGGRG